MATTVKLSDDFVQTARTHSQVTKRSLGKQIEYWAELGQTAEDNPDIPLSFIKEMLLAKAETETTPFTFGK